jgi:hypothetical protein
MCFNLKLSGNEVYYTILLVLLVKIMLCGKLHCQKVFKLKHISDEVRGVEAERLDAAVVPVQRFDVLCVRHLRLGCRFWGSSFISSPLKFAVRRHKFNTEPLSFGVKGLFGVLGVGVGFGFRVECLGVGT